MCDINVPDAIDELLREVHDTRVNVAELLTLCSEIKELCAEFAQKKNLVNNKNNEKIQLHRKHQRQPNRNKLH